ncbi:diacylglycerol/polyprenol kinase family protein [Anthocerotibacter panamensis]|uniref:diacylglycerol/polyprenol kinase family protein n=1 Tax=Anthocerotibacter panamensis TaxID=2857077 RepID=UPI001C407B4A|nr:diacylglycerol/polyprenol kinase family protein [Anthocerotibacter panamensis]
MWPYFLAVLWLALILLGAEVLRWSQVNPEWVRKFVHIGAGNIILLAWGAHFPLWVCVVFCGLFVGLTLLSYRLPILRSINGVGRRSLGTFYYALSFLLLISIFWTLRLPEFAVLGILVMTWGDSLAAIFGQKYGTHRYIVGSVQKTVEGTTVMALVSTAVSFAVLVGSHGFQPELLGVSLGIGLVAAGLEVFSQGGIDNLTVPLGSALLAWLWVGG